MAVRKNDTSEQEPDLDTDVLALFLERASEEAGPEVWILPVHLEGEVGQYRSRDVYSAKSLRSDGVRAAFLHDSDDRRFLHEHSAEIVYGVAFGVASNMTWDAAKAIWNYVRARAEELAQPGRSNVRVHVARIDTPSRTIENLTIEGPLSDATQARLIEALMGTGDADE